MRATRLGALALFILLVLPGIAGSKALQSGSDLDDRVREIIPSVVLIVGLGDEITLGTGFIISADGEIATNYHVIDGSDEVFAIWDSTIGRDYEQCTVEKIDRKLDAAILRLPGNDYQPIPLASVEDAELADDVICLGFPIVDSDDFQNDTFNIAVTRGIIASIQRDKQGKIDEIWTDAAITYGNSGGPLYDLDLGGVIGINNLFASEARGNYNLAIPYSLFESTMDKGTRPITPSTGIMLKKSANELLDEAWELRDGGDLSSAIEILENRLPFLAREETTDVKLQLAEWYIEAGRFIEAFDSYETLGSALPEEEDFLIDFGILAYQAGAHERSVELLLPYVNRGEAIVYLTLALAYVELEKNTEAETYAELAIDAASDEESSGPDAEEIESLAREVLNRISDDR